MSRERASTALQYDAGSGLALWLHATICADERFASSASVFVQIMNATPYSLLQRSFATKGAGQLERISA